MPNLTEIIDKLDDRNRTALMRFIFPARFKLVRTEGPAPYTWKSTETIEALHMDDLVDFGLVRVSGYGTATITELGIHVAEAIKESA